METDVEPAKKSQGRPAKVNEQKFADAWDFLKSQGFKNPTLNQLHGQIGGGSMTTLVKFQQRFREKEVDSKNSDAGTDLYQAHVHFQNTVKADMAAASDRELQQSIKNFETQQATAKIEADKTRYQRALLKERAEKAESALKRAEQDVADNKKLVQVTQKTTEKEIQELLESRESLNIEVATLSSKLLNAAKEIQLLNANAKQWEDKYESAQTKHIEDIEKANAKSEQLMHEMSASENAGREINEALKTKIAKMAAEIEKLLEQRQFEVERYEELRNRLGERDEDIIERKKEIGRLHSKADGKDKELAIQREQLRVLSARIVETESEIKLSRVELKKEKDTHRETQNWSDRTLKYKDQEIAELRKHVSGLISKISK